MTKARAAIKICIIDTESWLIVFTYKNISHEQCKNIETNVYLYVPSYTIQTLMKLSNASSPMMCLIDCLNIQQIASHTSQLYCIRNVSHYKFCFSLFNSFVPSLIYVNQQITTLGRKVNKLCQFNAFYIYSTYQRVKFLNGENRFCFAIKFVINFNGMKRKDRAYKIFIHF